MSEEHPPPWMLPRVEYVPPEKEVQGHVPREMQCTDNARAVPVAIFQGNTIACDRIEGRGRGRELAIDRFKNWSSAKEGGVKIVGDKFYYQGMLVQHKSIIRYLKQLISEELFYCSWPELVVAGYKIQHNKLYHNDVLVSDQETVLYCISAMLAACRK